MPAETLTSSPVDRCRTFIRVTLQRGESFLTSWDDFSELRDRCEESRSLSRSALLRAVTAGVRNGWLRPVWSGVGLTPWSGSAKRQRDYLITEIGKQAAASAPSEAADTSISGDCPSGGEN